MGAISAFKAIEIGAALLGLIFGIVASGFLYAFRNEIRAAERRRAELNYLRVKKAKESSARGQGTAHIV
jgi:type II secretory pathway pseudopilin PulG